MDKKPINLVVLSVYVGVTCLFITSDKVRFQWLFNAILMQTIYKSTNLRIRLFVSFIDFEKNIYVRFLSFSRTIKVVYICVFTLISLLRVWFWPFASWRCHVARCSALWRAPSPFGPGCKSFARSCAANCSVCSRRSSWLKRHART